MIELAGLGEVAGTRAGGFSLGMGQRLGVAAALLGRPQTVVLDEPVNGLDPDGVRWIRLLLKSLAAEGQTVFVSGREQEVFSHIATGQSNSEIVATLFLSEGTVKIHVGRILAKLGLRDRVQAVVLAYESRLISPGPPPPSSRR